MTEKKPSELVRFSLKKTILFSLIIIFAVMGILEGVSYWVISNFSETGTFNARVLQTQYHPFLGWEPPPNARLKTGKPWYGENKFIHTDAFGRSITPLAHEQPEVRIVITGGSTIFGVGQSSNETTIASLLEKKIFEKFGIRAEVFNLGVRGFNSFQELLRVREFLLTETADIVLAVSGRNDAYSAFGEAEVRSALLSRYVYDIAVDLVRRAEKQETIILNLGGFLRSKSHFIDLLARIVLRALGKLPQNEVVDDFPYEPDYGVIPKRAEITLANFRALQALTEFQGGRFYFVLIPTAYTWDDYAFDTPDSTPKQHKIQRAFESAYYDALRAGRGDLRFFDFTHRMNGRAKKPYVDKTHFSDEGAEIMASLLLDLVARDLMRLKQRKRAPR